MLLFPLLCTCALAEIGPPPADLDRLAPALADMQLVEALSNELPVIVRDSIKNAYQEKTLAEHGMTIEEFDELMWQIRQEPEWVDSLYARAGVLLARQAAEFGE